MEGKAPCEGSIHLLEDPPAAAEGTVPPPAAPPAPAAAADVEDEDWWPRASAAAPSLLEVAPGNKTAGEESLCDVPSLDERQDRTGLTEGQKEGREQRQQQDRGEVNR